MTSARASNSLQTASPTTMPLETTSVLYLITDFYRNQHRYYFTQDKTVQTAEWSKDGVQNDQVSWTDKRTRAGRVACGECWGQKRRERGRVAGGLADSTSAACSTRRAGTPQRHYPFVAEVCLPTTTIWGGILNICIILLDTCFAAVSFRL